MPRLSPLLLLFLLVTGTPAAATPAFTVDLEAMGFAPPQTAAVDVSYGRADIVHAANDLADSQPLLAAVLQTLHTFRLIQYSDPVTTTLSAAQALRIAALATGWVPVQREVDGDREVSVLVRLDGVRIRAVLAIAVEAGAEVSVGTATGNISAVQLALLGLATDGPRGLWALICASGCGPSTGPRVVASPPARGLTGETVVDAGSSILLYQVGLAGRTQKGALEAIALRLSPLAAPLDAGLAAGDIARLRLIESRDGRLGDGDDRQLGAVTGDDVDLTGGVTLLSANGAATPVGLLPRPLGALHRHYFVVADIATGATAGHALRLAADAGHVRTTVGDVGRAIAADNADRVVVDGLLPRLSVTSRTVALDTVVLGNTTTATIPLANVGAADLTVRAVASDDARFVAAPTSLTIPPGGSRVVGVTFTPAAAGDAGAQLTLDHDGPETPLHLQLRAHAVVGGGGDTLSVSDTGLAFGRVALGDTASLALAVTNPGAATVTVTAGTDASQFVVTPARFALRPGASRRLVVTCVPTASGATTATLTIGGDAPAPAVALTVSGHNSGLRALPASVAFGNSTFGQVNHKRLWLRNRSRAAIQVTDIASDDPQFSATPRSVRVPARDSVAVDLTFDPQSLGTKTASLQITHNGDDAAMAIPIEADATVALDDEFLNFGVVEAGDDAILPVRIGNPSGTMVTITSVVSDNPHFVPLRTTFDIPANGSEYLHVAFAPMGDEPETARLSVTHNPTLTITLVGNDRSGSYATKLASGGEPLPETQVPFGGEWLGGALLVLYALRRRSA